MEKDIISNTLLNESTAKIIKKIYSFSFAFLILVVLYTLFELINWALFFSKSYKIRSSFEFFFYYKIAPIISIVSLILQVSNAIMVYKAYAHMLMAIKNNDAVLLNKGFKIGYQTFYIIFSSMAIALIMSICRIYINLK